MNRKVFVLFTLTLLFLPSLSFSQWTAKWNSPGLNPAYAAGWVAFQKSGEDWTNKFYVVTATTFSVMDSEFSESALYTYTFTEPEQTAGNQVYSLGADLTGDGIVEFYILAYYGPSDNYRSSFKIIDIVTGDTVFEMDDPNYSFSYPVIWDIDDDGNWDCSFSRYDYPDYGAYSYQVYNTNVPTSVRRSSPVPLNFKLNQNYPNPFSKGTSGNISTAIPYSLSRSGNVSIKIYDVSGKLVKKLFSGYRTPGDYRVFWNGENSEGMRAASGTYFYQIEFNGKRQIKKMLLMK